MRKPFCDICGKEIITPIKDIEYAVGNLVAELVIRSADCGHADACKDCRLFLARKLIEVLQKEE